MPRAARRQRIDLALAVIALVLASVAARAAPATGDPPPSDRDCQVFVAVGRGLLGWGKTATDASMFPIFYRPDRHGGFIAQCPWEALGVTPLPPGAPDPAHMSFFTLPKYGRRGRSASVSYVVRLQPHDQPPSLSRQDCRLARVRKDWVFQGCVQAAQP